MIITNKTKSGTVTGWTTNCFSCGKSTTFTKVSTLLSGDVDKAIKKPDSVARCHPCWRKAIDSYRERHDLAN